LAEQKIAEEKAKQLAEKQQRELAEQKKAEEKARKHAEKQKKLRDSAEQAKKRADEKAEQQQKLRDEKKKSTQPKGALGRNATRSSKKSSENQSSSSDDESGEQPKGALGRNATRSSKKISENQSSSSDDESGVALRESPTDNGGQGKSSRTRSGNEKEKKTAKSKDNKEEAANSSEPSHGDDPRNPLATLVEESSKPIDEEDGKISRLEEEIFRMRNERKDDKNTICTLRKIIKKKEEENCQLKDMIRQQSEHVKKVEAMEEWRKDDRSVENFKEKSYLADFDEIGISVARFSSEWTWIEDWNNRPIGKNGKPEDVAREPLQHLRNMKCGEEFRLSRNVRTISFYVCLNLVYVLLAVLCSIFVSNQNTSIFIDEWERTEV
jgi:hypothetical protein